VTTGQAFRINTLHGPTGQILHVSPPLERRAPFTTLAPWTRSESEKLQGFCGESLVVSSPNLQSLVVVLRMRQLHPEPLGEPRLRRWNRVPEKPFPAEKAPALYNPVGFAHNLFFPECTTGKLFGGGKAFGCDLGGTHTACCSSVYTRRG